MPNFLFREFVGKQDKAGTAFVFLAGIEAVCALPLAYFLPSPSEVPLVLAVGLVAAVNSAMFATVRSKAWSVVLLAVNLVAIGFSLRVALDPSRFLSSASHLVIGLMCLGVFVLGFFKLPNGPMRGFLPAQQWALACTLISWMFVQQLHTQLGMLPEMDVRALFIGPLAVAVAALLSGFTGWKKWYILAWLGVGLGQYWIGIFDLAGHLDAPPVRRATLGLMAGFFLVLVAAATPARWSAGGRSSAAVLD
jgi:hypothetical protein